MNEEFGLAYSLFPNKAHPSARPWFSKHWRLSARAVVVCAVGAIALAASLFLPIPRASAADQIVLISMGPHTFYVPKPWIADLTLKARIEAELRKSGGGQPSPIITSHLAFMPRIPTWLQNTPTELEQWGPSLRRDLPDLIRLFYVGPIRAGPDQRPQLQDNRHALEQAASLEADPFGFVRVATGFTAPGKAPEWERFVYKGHQNAAGDALVVQSSNMGPIAPSTVHIYLQPDLNCEYRFDNRKFPERSWWELYQRVSSFVEFLQTPK